ncbi:concanavalin A-like lectin/glucanase domain-containing protein [Hypoxylon sp. FL1284]|nr:concanavalin A-like lectin/glucanase domain-containing protein [Hypoxylon sp. FL1284]
MATGYSLTTHYGGQGLLDTFSFFTGNDPSNGFVDYQSKDDAIVNSLVSVDSEYNSVRLGVDSNTVYSTSDRGRPSVRLTSPDSFTHGLFIADIYHMPASTCGTWPSFWAFNNQNNGMNWPEGGEVEIIEGANTAQRNLYSTHTTTGCKAPGSGFLGEQRAVDCSQSPENIGCNYASPTSDTASYGDAFNAEGGGVYALEWDSDALKIWHFPRSTIPDDIVYGHAVGPDPSTWGPPQAVFGGSSCDADTYFFNMSLVFNINFCGDYAGNLWGKADQCDQLAPTCKEFVAGNPTSFSEAYWDINFIDVYQFGPLTNTTIPPLSPNATSTTTATPIATAPPDDVTPAHTRTVTLTAASSPDIGGGEACVASCAGSRYVGVYNNTCYCADAIGDAGAVEIGLCDIPCSQGQPDEACGGRVDRGEASSPLADARPALAERGRAADAAAADMFLSVYADVSAELASPGAPAMGGCPVKAVGPAAITSTKNDVTVTAVAVQTVVPVPVPVARNTTAIAATLATGSLAYAVPTPSANANVPVVAAAPPRSRAAAVAWTLGWGVALWFCVFGLMSVL